MLNRTHPFVAILHLPTSFLYFLASASLIVVIGFGLGGIGCWAIVLGSLGGPPGEIVGDIVFVARAKTC